MYPEFIPIYIGLLVIIALLVTILILVLKRTSNNATAPKKITAANTAPNEAGTIVFCKNCAAQFESSQRCCPKCGTPR